MHVKYLIEEFQVFNIKPEVAVFKPHGSVNYAINRNAMYFSGDTKTIYDRKNIVTLNDTPTTVLRSNKLDCQRVSSDIVLPTEATQIRQFQYVAPGFRFIKSSRNEIARCIIVGLSYWDCDRSEINELLSYLHRNTKIILCNPFPDKDMVLHLKSRFQEVVLFKYDLPSNI